MTRSPLLGSFLAGLALVGLALTWQSDATAGVRKSDSQVKATAKATKPNEKGEQTITITMEILKGWHIYANPVDHEFLENGQTKVTVGAKVKPVAVDVKYPAGKKIVDGKDTYNIYEDRVTIQATVQRAPGDVSPLEISIAVQACNDKTCLQPGTVKLTVP
jgi:DsbC/DsbD-like thiol-disulfide interchange protein